LRALEGINLLEAAMTEPEITELETLGKARRDLVQQLLSDQYGIDADRLFACRSKVVIDDDGPPLVEVGL